MARPSTSLGTNGDGSGPDVIAGIRADLKIIRIMLYVGIALVLIQLVLVTG